MKDTIISAKRKKAELIFLLISFTIALGLNIYAIATYDTLWRELLSTFHITLLLTLVIYFLLWVIRIIILGILLLSRRLSKN